MKNDFFVGLFFFFFCSSIFFATKRENRENFILPLSFRDHRPSLFPSTVVVFSLRLGDVLSMLTITSGEEFYGVNQPNGIALIEQFVSDAVIGGIVNRFKWMYASSSAQRQ